MKTTLIYSVILAGILMILATCNTPKPEQMKLKIFQTTDVHGAIFPFDFIQNTEKSTSLAQVYQYIDKQRQQTNQQVVLLDNGDILQGQPTVYYYNFEDTTSQHLLARVMNFMGYDAGTVGNHDIEAGHAVYDKFVQELNFPWLAANAVNTKTEEPYFVPYTIINKEGVKIAILGLVTPGIPQWLPENIWSGMRFDDMIETARKWVKIIQQQENPDVLIGLFHSGIDATYGNADAAAPLNENATKLVAEQVSGFDIIMAGHDHKKVNQLVKNPEGKEVVLIDPQSSARSLAEITIDLKWNKKEQRYDKQIKSELIDISTIEASKEFMSTFAAEYNQIQKYVSQEVAYFEKSINSQSAYFQDNELIDLIHGVQLELTGADISFAAPLSFQTQLDSGALYVRDMFKIYRYENLLYTMQLSGKEIKDFLEYSYAGWMNTMQTKNDEMLKYKTDTEGKKLFATSFYNFDSAEGITYTVDLSKPEGNRVTILGMQNGNAFSIEKKYKVAINSYRGNGGGGHLINGAGIASDSLSSRILASTEKDLRYYIMQNLKNKKNISPTRSNNWKVIPEAWIKIASEKEYNELFGQK